MCMDEDFQIEFDLDIPPARPVKVDVDEDGEKPVYDEIDIPPANGWVKTDLDGKPLGDNPKAVVSAIRKARQDRYGTLDDGPDLVEVQDLDSRFTGDPSENWS